MANPTCRSCDRSADAGAYCSSCAAGIMTSALVNSKLERGIETLEEVNPPRDVSEYHSALIAYIKSIKTAVDHYGGSRDDEISFEGYAAMVEAGFEPLLAMSAAAEAMSPEARERLTASGCIDETLVESASLLEAGSTDGQAFNSQFEIERCELTLGENREALVTLYNATGGPNWTDSENWLTDAPLSDWAGVGANSESWEDRLVAECVNGLRLSDNQLTGEIPVELLAKLSKMDQLSLDGNQLTGENPVGLGELAGLTRLNLAENRLTGEIPAELGKLSKLENLDLSENQLTGEIPAELGELQNLKWVALRGNAFTGCVPQSLLDVNGDADRLDLPACN